MDVKCTIRHACASPCEEHIVLCESWSRKIAAASQNKCRMLSEAKPFAESHTSVKVASLPGIMYKWVEHEWGKMCMHMMRYPKLKLCTSSACALRNSMAKNGSNSNSPVHLSRKAHASHVGHVLTRRPNNGDEFSWVGVSSAISQDGL